MALQFLLLFRHEFLVHESVAVVRFVISDPDFSLHW